MRGRKAYTWTPERFARAQRMVADGMSGLQVDSELGLRPGATTAKISRMRRPEEKRRRRETPPETRVVQKHGPSRAELEGRERREAADRTLTALICGDPAPGFSALDRRR